MFQSPRKKLKILKTFYLSVNGSLRTFHCLPSSVPCCFYLLKDPNQKILHVCLNQGDQTRLLHASYHSQVPFILQATFFGSVGRHIFKGSVLIIDEASKIQVTSVMNTFLVNFLPMTARQQLVEAMNYSNVGVM